MSANIKNVVFMGTPEFAVPSLVAIHRNFHIAAVYTQPDKPVGRGRKVRYSPVKAQALELNLVVKQPERLNVKELWEELAAFQPDVIVVVAFGQILRQEVLDIPRLGCLNIHSSLLPRWRGAAPIQWAILSGDTESGVSVQKIVQRLDAGDVLKQARTPLSATETASSLHDRLSIMGADLIVETLKSLDVGDLNAEAQDETRVTYAKKLEKEMQWISPDLKAKEADRRIRALNPWPGTSLQLDWEQKRLRIHSARLDEEVTGRAGQIFEQSGLLYLGLEGGSLELKELQWEGKKVMQAADFLNGLKGSGQSLPIRVGFPPKNV